MSKVSTMRLGAFNSCSIPLLGDDPTRDSNLADATPIAYAGALAQMKE
jgi:hypothetical protein